MTDETDTCPHCHAPLPPFTPECPACGSNLGFPNVRIANSPDELRALNQRLQASRQRAESQGISRGFAELLDYVAEHSCVVVSMPAELALSIVTDSNIQFVNYEKLVGAGARQPAVFANDAHRRVVSGALFGSYGDRIVYGALSLSDRGLKTYGDIYCLLRTLAVDKRTSFLSTNSYQFIEKFGGTSYPLGYRCDWGNRAKLVASKLEENESIRLNQTPQDWEQLVLVSDGKDRTRDEFVEAHIFGSFNIFTIQKMVAAQPIDSNKKALISSVLAAFDSTKSMPSPT